MSKENLYPVLSLFVDVVSQASFVELPEPLVLPLPRSVVIPLERGATSGLVLIAEKFVTLPLLCKKDCLDVVAMVVVFSLRDLISSLILSPKRLVAEGVDLLAIILYFGIKAFCILSFLVLLLDTMLWAISLNVSPVSVLRIFRSSTLLD